MLGSIDISIMVKVNKPKAVSLHDIKWLARWNELKDFKALNGHCDVPFANNGLSSWMSKQRQRCEKIDRIELLDSIGFEWGVLAELGVRNQDDNDKTVHDIKWLARWNELNDFKALNGHCNVPFAKTGLGFWLYKQRRSC